VVAWCCGKAAIATATDPASSLWGRGQLLLVATCCASRSKKSKRLLQQEGTMSLLSLQKAMAGKELSQAEMFEITRREMAMTQDMYNRCASRVF